MAKTGMNRVILIGDVCDTPKLRSLQAGTLLAIRLHTVEAMPDDDGQMRDRQAWHTVVVWGKRAEALSKILARGMRLAIEGRLVNRKWDDMTGRHHVSEVYASELVILDSEKRDAA